MENRKVKIAKLKKNAELKTEFSYSSTFEYSFFNVLIHVLESYEITKDSTGSLWISASFFNENTTYKRPDIEKFIKKTYNPFEIEYLFEIINSIDINDHESILNFCNEYGLFNTNEKVYTSPSFRLSVELKPLLRVPLITFKWEVKQLQKILKVWRKIQENDIEFARNFFINEYKEYLEAYKSDFEYYQSSKNDNNIYQEELRYIKKELRYIEERSKLTFNQIKNEIDPEKVLHAAKEQLAKNINVRIKNVVPQLKVSDDGNFIASYTSAGLLSVAYFQLYEMLIKGLKLEKCLKCDSLFVPRKEGTKFCPPKEAGKNSNCRNAYEQMKRRTREAILHGKKTIEQEAQRLNRSLEEVQSWIEEYSGKLKK